ncbi:MAG: PEP-CTERM system TPR-repeat protein PrsT [Gammaproteobacteria bacterium]|nr:PEP-CTERM system TPR-repeat protein PrsT [Rhodocyclaceae bacterium]MBU3910116.1 PEP-CTERM system TPR-repeat protein PrsT [Gammaproteobacteria bacterium]MBU3989884.1 PEP-CTERM system TPR-repeat protein PrsT [Gammaproteobacteria bacterium]MBU4006124.1 PEP-CTERM system TPR-repeat protein PrsT [Gammaproteobacteria bacterium]MBU4022578.1 PEP-CTERM system TPR-repeat protein PrsT [Gammaproteobacteria bacterium]
MTTYTHTRIVRIAALTVLLLAAGCGKGSPEEMLVSAKSYLEKNDHAAATIQLKNVLMKAPDSGEARFLLGRVLLESGDPAAAEIELRKAMELKFSPDQITPVLARALLAQGQYKKVIEDLSKVALISAEAKADFKTTLGQVYATQGKLEAARNAFNEAVASKNDFAPALLGLAQLKAAEQDLPQAKEMVDSILAKAPQNAEAWNFKASLLRAEGKDDEAIAAYQKVVEIRPQMVSAQAAMIMMHLRKNQTDLAAKRLEAMQNVAAKVPLTLYMQGMVAYAQKNAVAAKSAVDALLKVQPDNPQGLQLAGIIAYDSRSDVQAQEYLSKALQRAPGLDSSRRALARSYLRSGQPEKALATLQPVLQGKETAAAWLTLAGEAYMQSGDAAAAAEFFTKAAKTDPQNARTQTALALAKMQMGRTDQAFAELEEIAAADTGVMADMALIASNMQQKQFDKALKAIASFEKKQPDNPVVHNLRGGALLGKGDTAGARKSFERALELAPTFLPAAANLARLDLANKKPDEARKRFEAVLAKDPKNLQAMLAIAELRAQGGATVEEIAGLLTKAVNAVPDDPAPRLALVGLYLRTNDNKKALTAVQEAMATFPDRPEIMDAAGRVMQLTGDTNQALAIYGKLAAMLPGTAQPYLRMAEIQVAEKNKEGARNSLTKGLALQPDSLPMHRAMIMLDVDAGRIPEALARARDMQKSHPKEIAGHLLEGDIQVAQRAWPQAAAAYRAGLKVAASADLTGRLHAVLFADGKGAEAKQLADAWIKAHPKDDVFRLFIADSANKRKDYPAAVAQYRALLSTQPNNPVLLNNLAWSLGRMGDPKAIEHAEQANKLAPNHPAIMDTLGRLLVDKGNVERGLDLLGKAVALAPQAADIRLNLARGLIKAGKKAEAKQELETLAKLGDKFPGQAEVSELLKSL